MYRKEKKLGNTGIPGAQVSASLSQLSTILPFEESITNFWWDPCDSLASVGS